MKSYTIFLVGPEGVGKTTLQFALIFDKFAAKFRKDIGGTGAFDEHNNQFGSIGAWGNEKIVSLENSDDEVEIKISRYPLGKFIAATKMAVKMSDLMILCYDVNNVESISSIRNWLHTLRDKFSLEIPHLALVGTKGDLTLNINFGEIEALKNEENIVFDIITSAKKMENIEELIKNIVEYCHKQRSD